MGKLCLRTTSLDIFPFLPSDMICIKCAAETLPVTVGAAELDTNVSNAVLVSGDQICSKIEVRSC